MEEQEVAQEAPAAVDVVEVDNETTEVKGVDANGYKTISLNGRVSLNGKVGKGAQWVLDENDKPKMHKATFPVYYGTSLASFLKHFNDLLPGEFGGENLTRSLVEAAGDVKAQGTARTLIERGVSIDEVEDFMTNTWHLAYKGPGKTVSAEAQFDRIQEQDPERAFRMIAGTGKLGEEALLEICESFGLDESIAQEYI